MASAPVRRLSVTLEQQKEFEKLSPFELKDKLIHWLAKRLSIALRPCSMRVAAIRTGLRRLPARPTFTSAPSQSKSRNESGTSPTWAECHKASGIGETRFDDFVSEKRQCTGRCDAQSRHRIRRKRN